MARPKKKTVDYFPHSTKHGKTMFVLEAKWGNDGYAFWFKLLEVLGDSNGLFYDCNNPAEWQFILAKTRVTEVMANEILDCLSDLGAIDAEFWGKKVIYSQNFVDGVADAFKRRLELLPDRNIVNAHINPVNGEFTSTENRKGKRKESKGKEKEKVEAAAPAHFSCIYFAILPDYHAELQKDYPLLNMDRIYRNVKEYVDDNPSRWKRKSTGVLSSPKSIIRKWCEREKPHKTGMPGNGSEMQQTVDALQRFVEKGDYCGQSDFCTGISNP